MELGHGDDGEHTRGMGILETHSIWWPVSLGVNGPVGAGGTSTQH